MVESEVFIRLAAVSKHFGLVIAVDDVSVDIRQGEFFSLPGPSGCGKTTLLRIVTGFESATSGEIYLDEMPMSGVLAHERPTNMVFQNYAIFPHLNVRANVAYGLRRERLTKDESNRRVGEALSMVKLDGFENRRSNEISSGQRQRVALARALVKRPKVLLDEPLGALDKKLREEMQLELRALQRSVGITFIFVTHDQEEALTMSDRIAVMSRGQAIQIASPKELYERPNSIEVAGFIGTMNFFPGSVKRVEHGKAWVETNDLGVIEASPEGDFVRPDAEITVAIRPEKLHIRAVAPHDGLSTATTGPT